MPHINHRHTAKKEFPALTGIRAVAAFMVFFHHMFLKMIPDALIGLQLSLHIGVTFFFVLSGFLITYRYYGKIVFTRQGLGAYFLNRFARIYPVYFLVLTIVIVINKQSAFLFLLQNYTLTHHLFFLFPSCGIAIKPSWSLTVEECFYISAPLIFWLSHSCKLWLALAISALVYLLFLFSYGKGDPLHGTGYSLSISSFVGRFVEFYTGIYLAKTVLLCEKEKVNKPPKYYTALSIVAISLLLLPLIYITNKPEINNPVTLLVNNLVLPIPIAMLYFGLIYERTFISKLLASGTMRLLGKSSYAFYLLHVPFIEYCAKPYIASYFPDKYYNLFVLLTFLMVLALSIFVYLFYEEPMNRVIRRRLGSLNGSIVQPST